MWGIIPGILGYLMGRQSGYESSREHDCNVVENGCDTLLKDYDRKNRLELAAINIRNEPSDLYERHEELYRQQQDRRNNK